MAPFDPKALFSFNVELSNLQAHLLVEPAWVRQIVELTLKNEQVAQGDISIILTDNASIRSINARFLNHDWATDVISFPYSAQPIGRIEGELFISVEMATLTAARAGHAPSDELALYLVHGLLHLCGYDDQTPAAADLIRDREAVVLKLLGIENPFFRSIENSAMSESSGRESVRWPR